MAASDLAYTLARGHAHRPVHRDGLPPACGSSGFCEVADGDALMTRRWDTIEGTGLGLLRQVAVGGVGTQLLTSGPVFAATIWLRFGDRHKSQDSRPRR